MALLRIRKVEALKGFKLRLTLTDGSIVEREVSRLLVGPVFESIRTDPALFGQVRAEGGTVAERRRSLPGRFNMGCASSRRKRRLITAGGGGGGSWSQIVNPPKPHYLFNRGELRALVDARESELAAEIAALEEDYLLKADANKRSLHDRSE